MKIMVYNTQHCLNYITREIDYDLIANIIKDLDPDIVGLNEMRNAGVSPDYHDQTKILSDLTGMAHGYFAQAIKFGGNDPYGNAFLSKIPIEKAETIPVPDPSPRKYKGYYETRCLLKVKLTNGLNVLVIHFGLNPDEHINAVETIMEHITEENCILMGDFNVTPDSDILTPIRRKLKDTADLFSSPLLSFPSDKPDRKIDYIFTSKDIEILSADIPPIVGSDHRPHIAQISMNTDDDQ